LEFFERLLPGGLALGAESAELGHTLRNGAVDALLVEGQKLEIVALGNPGAGFDQRFVGGNRFGVVESPAASVFELTALARGEDGGLDGACAFEAPMASAMPWAISISNAPTGWRDSRMPAQWSSKASFSAAVWRWIWPVRPCL